MFCPRCGHATPVDTGRCPACGVALASATVATGVIAIDTTGLAPGATFGASTGVNALAATGTGPATIAPDVPARVAGPLVGGQSFGPRYHIIKLLGLGGMGAVYQAWDAELGVAVALKVIRIDRRHGSVSSEVEKRFKNELLLARQVTHKNVVRIHDLGEIDGVKYITMPYVQGDDLAAVLRREVKLPIARALSLARQIAGGLAAAHEAGVVHRDLKPPNIMIGADDLALIMDFGISASTTDAATGGVIGTLEYMAPEQGSGQQVDARADIYSFGLILHEMLVGPRTPPAAATGQARVDAMKKRFEEGIPSARAIDPSIPEPLDALITRCVARDPAARYQTTADLCGALAALDDAGELIPIPARIPKRALAAAMAAVVVLLGGMYFVGRRAVPAAPVQHAPVSVLIADFENRANDPAFQGTLEAALGAGIESASFINSFDRADARKLAEQYKAGSHVDEQIARLISVREGINIILTGSIEAQKAGYLLSVKMFDTAKLIVEDQAALSKVMTATASSKADVLNAVKSLAAQARTTLGDKTPAPQLRAADETYTAASLDAIRSYTIAQDFANADKDEQAAEYYRRAIDQDPNFGRAYAGLALSTEILGRKDESAELWKKALSLLDRMTEREKYRTLGVYYRRVAHNNDKAIETFTALVERFPADATGYNNLAVAYFANLNFPKAFEAGRRALEIAPKRERYRSNYALYAMYAGDFDRSATEAAQIVKDNPDTRFAYLPLAIAALAGDKPDAARNVYQQMAHTGAAGASLANMGLADMAIYQRRYADAEALLRAGLAEDRRAKVATLVAAKHLALAEGYLAQRKTALALDAIRQALAADHDETVLVPAARLFVRAGIEAEANRIASGLLNSLQPQSRAYGNVIAGEIALRSHRMVDAVESFRAALKLADLWLTRFALGTAYVEAEHYPEALAELDACVKRRGEATAVFLDDVPSFRYLATLPYWLGRAQEGVELKPKAAASFTQFLKLAAADASDPLAADARRRLAAIAP